MPMKSGLRLEKLKTSESYLNPLPFSWQYYLLKGSLKVGSTLYQPKSLNVKQVRDLFEGFGQSMIPYPAIIGPASIPNLSAEWIIPPALLENDFVILYLHGGGYFMGSSQTHRSYLSYFAKTMQTPVLSLEYRLAPYHPFPAALEDSLKAYSYLLKRFNPSQIVLAGESAGGGLVLSTIHYLKSNKLSLPGAALCFSPWTDLGLTGESLKKNKKSDPLIPFHLLKESVSLYLKHKKEVKDPLVSPLYADFRGFPPLFIQASANEMLLSDSLRVGEKAKQAGVNVTMDIWKDMFHAWPYFSPFLPEGRQALERAHSFLKKLNSEKKSVSRAV
jgi:monoterpene epsilon-lactone hydrolase